MAKKAGNSENATYDVVFPLGIQTSSQVKLAPRLDTLSGKTICELWDNVFRGDAVHKELEAHLSEQYPGIRFVSYDEFGNTHGVGEEEVLTSLPEKLRKNHCDAVISAIGG